jgi:chromosome segregation ATPase
MSEHSFTSGDDTTAYQCVSQDERDKIHRVVKDDFQHIRRIAQLILHKVLSASNLATDLGRLASKTKAFETELGDFEEWMKTYQLLFKSSEDLWKKVNEDFDEDGGLLKATIHGAMVERYESVLMEAEIHKDEQEQQLKQAKQRLEQAEQLRVQAARELEDLREGNTQADQKLADLKEDLADMGRSEETESTEYIETSTGVKNSQHGSNGSLNKKRKVQHADL